MLQYQRLNTESAECGITLKEIGKTTVATPSSKLIVDNNVEITNDKDFVNAINNYITEIGLAARRF